MSDATPAGELRGLTALRGIAALGVVLFHVDVLLFYREVGKLLPKTASGLIANGYLWVDLFFVLSGYVIHHAYRDRLASGFRWSTAAAFYRARFFRVYPLHLVLTLVVVVGAVIAGAVWPSLKDGSWTGWFAWSALPSNLLLTHAMGQHPALSWNIVSWSIGAEWWSYALAPLLAPVLVRRWAGVAAMAVGAVVLAATVYVSGKGTLDLTYDHGALRCAGGFLVGLGLYAVHRGRPLGGRTSAALALVALAGLAAVFHVDANDLLAVPLFALLVVAAAGRDGPLVRVASAPPLQALGRISYSVYLVHGLVFLVFWFAVPASGLRFHALPAAWVFAALFVGVTLAVSAVTYAAIERPGRDLGRARSSGARDVAVRPAA